MLSGFRGMLSGFRVILSGAKEPWRRFGSFAPLRMTRGLAPGPNPGLAPACAPRCAPGPTPLLLALVALTLALPAAAQVSGQHWEVIPETDSARIGDTVTVRFRLHLDERDLLYDTLPRAAENTPDWVRVLQVDKLRRDPNRVFLGRARVAFYRTGRQAVPIFELPFMRSVKGLSRGTLPSDSASVEIVPLIADPSSATLRDIKEPPVPRGPGPLALAGGLAALLVTGLIAWRLHRRAPAEAPVPAADVEAAPPPPPDPYDIALARLGEIERERWSARDVARHYEAVTDALRGYLEARGVPARERTTSELRWLLPPGLQAGGTRHRFEEIFGDADLVKFAKWRPDARTAAAFLADARELLGGWRAAAPAEDMVADAVR
jgi:hypothetical protein